jgi:hypothetical protein
LLKKFAKLKIAGAHKLRGEFKLLNTGQKPLEEAGTGLPGEASVAAARKGSVRPVLRENADRVLTWWRGLT